MDEIAKVLGYALMVTGGTALASASVIGAVVLFNKALWRALEPYGGIKAFRRFVQWHHAQLESQKKA